MPSLFRSGTSSDRELTALWRLAAPLIVSHLGNQLMGVVDAAMVGRLGAAALAGVGIGNAVYFAVETLALGFVLGMEAPVAQAIGSRDRWRARRVLWQGVRVALVVSVPAMLLILLSLPLLERFGVAPEIVHETTRYVWARVLNGVPFLLFNVQRSYLQACGVTRPIVAATIVGNVVNFVGNLLLIYGDGALIRLGLPRLGIPALGVVGSGLSSTLAGFAMVWLVGRAVQLVDTPEGRAHRTFDGPVVKTILRLGAPLGLQLLAEVGAFSIVGLCAGRLGKGAAAGHLIAITLASCTFCVTLGIGAAASVRVGTYVGAEDSAGARRAGLLALGSSAVFMTGAALLFLFFPNLLARLLSDDPLVIASAVPLLRIAAVFQISDGLQATGAGALRGAGDAHAPLFANLVGHYVIGLPLALLLCFDYGLGARGLWWGLSTGLTAVAIGLTARFWTLSRRPIRRV